MFRDLWRRCHRGRSGLILIILVVSVASGCMNQQLRRTACRNLSTLPELQYQQVVDNLAATASNPGSLPYLAVVGQGSIQVTDVGNSSVGINLTPSTLSSSVLGLGAQRNLTGTWSMGTVTSPEKIRGMQAVYERAVLGATEGDDGYSWLNIGCRRDVPRDASYVGRRGRTYVWVMPEGMSNLSDLTLSIVDIATREDSEPGQPTNSPPRLFGPQPVPRRNFQVPPSGPVFTPAVR
jgi:hypothetical protein